MRAPAGRRELRTRFITVRLNETELQVIRRRAGKAHRTVSDFARRAMMGKRIPVPPKVPVVNQDCVGQLNRLGNNLNQLLVQIYTYQAPLGLRSTVHNLLTLVKGIRRQLMGMPPERGGEAEAPPGAAGRESPAGDGEGGGEGDLRNEGDLGERSDREDQDGRE